MRINEAVIKQSIDSFLKFGLSDKPHEGIVYWAGKRDPKGVIVIRCLTPNAKTAWGSFQTSAQANAEIIKILCKEHLELIGQVHTHPGKFVGHSDGDDQLALMPYEGFLSIVVPQYARGGMLPLTKCGVHVFENGYFRRLGSVEIKKTFHVI
ncbi:MAG: Mov34/MPN/PAD-1 family protein [Ignavibacteriales bacterium]|nr:Mov34/MPN/PAD-1 family protein [Ignavibacteriales bacterium]